MQFVLRIIIYLIALDTAAHRFRQLLVLQLNSLAQPTFYHTCITRDSLHGIRFENTRARLFTRISTRVLLPFSPSFLPSFLVRVPRFLARVLRMTNCDRNKPKHLVLQSPCNREDGTRTREEGSMLVIIQLETKDFTELFAQNCPSPSFVMHSMTLETAGYPTFVSSPRRFGAARSIILNKHILKNVRVFEEERQWVYIQIINNLYIYI